MKWTPRLIALAHSLFLGVLSLDAFEAEAGIGRNIIAFAIHLIPSAAGLAALAIAWKRKTAGGLLLLALAAMIFLLTGTDEETGTYFLLVAPPIVAGVLFILGGSKG